MKNWQRVMWGKMLWALFLPQEKRDCCQKCESCWSRGPLGRRYNTYSLGRGSSRKGSSTWEKSLEKQMTHPRTHEMMSKKLKKVRGQLTLSRGQYCCNSTVCWGDRSAGVMFLRVSVCFHTTHWDVRKECVWGNKLFLPVTRCLDVFASCRNQSFQAAKEKDQERSKHGHTIDSLSSGAGLIRRRLLHFHLTKNKEQTSQESSKITTSIQ